MKRYLFLAASLGASFFASLPAALADGGVAIVVPAHDIARGEAISESDLTIRTVDAANVLSGTVTKMADLVGMQTRRVLHAGESVRADDVRHPVLVTKGQTVTMSFSAPGITLTALGRAMSEGGLGETVLIENPASFRTITATVTGLGAVGAVGTAMSMNSNIVAKR